MLRCFVAKIGLGVRVYPNAKILMPWNFDLADECGVANGAILYSIAKITIYRQVVFSQGAHICTGTHNHTHLGSSFVALPTQTGDLVWIVAEAYVHPNIAMERAM